MQGFLVQWDSRFKREGQSVAPWTNKLVKKKKNQTEYKQLISP